MELEKGSCQKELDFDFKKCEKMLTEAKACQDRMEKDMCKLKQHTEKANEPDTVGTLKKLLTCCLPEARFGLWTWRELPGHDGEKLTHTRLKTWTHQLATQAPQTEQNKEGIQSLKAILKARNFWPQRLRTLLLWLRL